MTRNFCKRTMPFAMYSCNLWSKVLIRFTEHNRTSSIYKPATQRSKDCLHFLPMKVLLTCWRYGLWHNVQGGVTTDHTHSVRGGGDHRPHPQCTGRGWPLTTPTVYREGVTIDHIQKEPIKLVYKDVELFQTLLPIITAVHTTETSWGHQVISSRSFCDWLLRE